MIQVWADGQTAGLLDREAERGTTFAPEPGVPLARAVSLTMPPRLASYTWPRGLLPVFEMNLPEGALRERLRRQFAKATGHFDALDLLTIVGRTQLGRLRYSAPGAALDEAVPLQRVTDILAARRDGDLFAYLLETFAPHSGVSGVQPKVLIRDDAGVGRRSPRILGATHLVKLWEPDEFPELAANEYACLDAARRAGLPVARAQLAESGAALVVERFDRRADGSYGGMEDLCVLNGRNTDDKYRGSYETAVLRRVRQFVDPAEAHGAVRQLFQMLVLTAAVRNGDAHLKNFAVLYDDPTTPVRLAPVYDVVTTTAYLPHDHLALTFQGSTRWPAPRALRDFGVQHCDLKPAEVTEILERTADAMRDAWQAMAPYFAQCPKPEVGTRMAAAWEAGIAETLGRTAGR